MVDHVNPRTRKVVLQGLLDEAIRHRHFDELKEAFAEFHPADTAETLDDLSADEAAIVFRLLPRLQAARVFAFLEPASQERLLHQLGEADSSALVSALKPDERTRLLDALPAEITRRVLESLPPDKLKAARELLGYPPGTAGRAMTPAVLAIPETWSVQMVLARVREQAHEKETVNVVYVVTEKGRLKAEIRLATLLASQGDKAVGQVVDRPLVSILATASREDLIATFRKYHRTVLPVTDEDRVLLGILTLDDALKIAEAETTRDLQKSGGMESLNAPYLATSLPRLLRKRGGWLSALFLSEMLTATAMGHYQAELAHAVVLALFVPLIISSGGNSGSQAATLIVRSLALQEMELRDWWRVFRRELVGGVVLGAWLGMIGFARVVLWQKMHIFDYGTHSLRVALTVWGSLVGVVAFGSLVGSMLPFAFRRLHLDPATSSAPFVATLVDVTGLVIYFTVAGLVLGGLSP